MQKDKRYLKLCDTTVSFSVELPGNYIPDNNFGEKLFESLELTINHEQITRKSTALNYALSAGFFERVSYDDSYILASMDVNGTYDPKNQDVPDLGQGFVNGRIACGEKFFKTEQHSNEAYQVPWRRWYLILPINHGLARVSDCLPSDITVSFRFHRARAECAFLKISNTVECIKVKDKSKHNMPLTFMESYVPLVNPRLNAFYAFSPQLDSTMSRLAHSNMEITYMGKNQIFK